ncbi:MAG TPA: preprotein translocase subunit SecG [Thermoanaerobaculia bacterium]|nr:preprotein translocase subunit SecG [Thermoanaerobaculia bacterium]
MIYLLYTVHVLVCVFLILVVLLQQGKGADLSVFGGGSTQTAFGARGATTFLHKLTVASFVIFVLTTLAIGIPQLGGGGSVMKGAASAGKGTAGNRALPPPKPAPAVPSQQRIPVTAVPMPAAPAPGAPAAKPPAPAKPPAAPSPGTPR